jgi:hypothetical protein
MSNKEFLMHLLLLLILYFYFLNLFLFDATLKLGYAEQKYSKFLN